MNGGLFSVCWLQAELTQPSVQGVRASGQRKQEVKKETRSAFQASEASAHEPDEFLSEETTLTPCIAGPHMHTHRRAAGLLASAAY